VYVLPVRPHVNGFRELRVGSRPCLSSRMNSLIGTESGGAAMFEVSRGIQLASSGKPLVLLHRISADVPGSNSGIHDGGVKGIVRSFLVYDLR
jgi:hypothetical protein